jgi:Ca2+-dependent lipid-binding protein
MESFRNLWPSINAAVCETIRSTVEPTFAKKLPGPFLNTLKFVELDLGVTPVTVDNAIVHEESRTTVQFEFDVAWDGDANIRLRADYIGSVGVSKLKFCGRVSVLLAPVVPVLPIVAAAQVCFIDPPSLDVDFLGLANVADATLIKKEIVNLISTSIADMMVLPNRMYYRVDASTSFLDLYQPAIGVIRMTVHSGSGFDGKGKGLLGDAHDLYVVAEMGGGGSSGGQRYTTKTINNASDPVWNETFDFVCYDVEQHIQLKVWDSDVDADDDLGSGQVSVRQMRLPGRCTTTTMQLQGGGNNRHGDKLPRTIQLSCRLCSLTMSDMSSLTSQEDNNLMCGLVTILVVGVKNLAMDRKEAKTSIKVMYGEHEFRTITVAGGDATTAGVDCLNPVYDAAFTVPLKPGADMNVPIEFTLLNGTDQVMGTTQIAGEDLLRRRTITEVRPIGEEGVSVEFRVSMTGIVPPTTSETDAVPSGSDLAAVHATTSTVTSKTAIGTVRLTVLKGWGFQVQRSRRLILGKDDVPDVYCTVVFGSSPTIWKTSTVSNSVSPEWNESANYLLSDHGQVISIRVFDEDRKDDSSKDDELGSARVPVSRLLLAGRITDIELLRDGKPTGQYLSLRCDVLEHHSVVGGVYE